MPNYDNYNREERAICAHLFRLLHENLDSKEESPLGQFISILSKNNLSFKNGNGSFQNLRYDNVTIFCEVSIIRDAYQNTRPDINPFMDDLTQLIMKQENISDCRLYSQLPKPLNVISLTHPKQIKQKAKSVGIQLSESENKVYGIMQAMFNAKPDLVITIDNLLLVCEAKFTEPFDAEQLHRTDCIAEVWANLLYKDLGFNEPPIYSVFKLGAAVFNPHISWKDISAIADNTYSTYDRTRIAIKKGVELLNHKFLN
ncbi:MAG: hypothetical protein KKG99_12945 [Bacteroidetes bacterium]|nr:hypothetical protein [Bacteroidota bacterium]